MKSGEILIKKLEAKGIAGGELLAAKVIEAFEETFVEVAVSAEAEPVEKTIAAVLSPIFAGFKPSLNQLIDFNKDGKIG